MDDEECELLRVEQVFVFKVPPRPSAGGYKAGEWKDQVWKGRLTVVSKGPHAAVKLINKETEKLFAVCVVRPEGPQAIEKATDSSRYFVLRIEDGKGNHAFIGLGFPDRGGAFDFNAALQEHADDVKRTKEGSTVDYGPSTDFALKEGETIRINVPKTSGGPPKPRTTLTGSRGGGGLLSPPPAAPTGRSKRSARAGGSRAAAPAPAPAFAAPAPASASDPFATFGAPAPAPAPAGFAGFDDDPFGAPAPAPAPAKDPFGF